MKNVIFTILFLALGQSCASLSGEAVPASSPEVVRLAKLVSEQRGQIQKLENENGVLKSKLRQLQKSGEVRPVPKLDLGGLNQLLRQGRYAEVLKETNVLLREVPRGPVTPELLGLKAKALHELMLPGFAESIWKEILRDFPQSSQARHAQIMLNQTTLQ